MIIQSSAETLHKVLWVLLVLILPLVGLIIWALMGPGSPLKR
ncbi:PLDc N-terminal domain-containing protein [Alcanivorax sp. HI0033]